LSILWLSAVTDFLLVPCLSLKFCINFCPICQLQSEASSHVYHHCKSLFWQASLVLNINFSLVIHSVHWNRLDCMSPVDVW
jgi:hypothetical protein